MVRVRDRDDHEVLDPREVVRIAGEEGQPVRQGNGRDHRVVGPRVRLPARAAKRRRNLAECSGRLDIEGKRIEVGFCLLEMCKAGSSFGLVCRNERPDSSASVMVEISGWSGSAVASPSRGNKINVFVSSRPVLASLTGAGRR
jgi:hypothetical protein